LLRALFGDAPASAGDNSSNGDNGGRRVSKTRLRSPSGRVSPEQERARSRPARRPWDPDSAPAPASTFSSPDLHSEPARPEPARAHTLPSLRAGSDLPPPPPPPPLPLPGALVLTGLERIGAPAQRCLAQTLADRRFTVALGGGADQDKDRHEDGDHAVHEHEYELPPGFIVVYVCADDAHERPDVHWALVSAPSPSPHPRPHDRPR
jgi:hypothetical protein